MAPRRTALVLGILAAATAGALALKREQDRRRARLTRAPGPGPAGSGPRPSGAGAAGPGGGPGAAGTDPASGGTQTGGAGTAGGSARPVGSTSRSSRTAQVAALGARSGASWALHRARRAVAPADRRPELDARFELRTAEQVVARLGQMKGALMKLGQLASYLDQGLPDNVRQALAELQSDAPPMSAELAASVVAADLGAPPAELFAEWDPRPLAAASIGQVHRARTRDGRAVAVKVQYPGVAEAIRADLDNADLMFGALGLLFPGLEPGPLVDELTARITEELDYELEARNQQLFVDAYRGHPTVQVPEVLHDLSGPRVLTTELAEGVPFSVVETWSQAERDLAAETIFRFVFRSLYRVHAFNGDPHPGNYLFRPGGEVTFVDFGLVKRFSPPEIDRLGRMIRAMVLDRDIPEFRRIVEEAGLLRPGAPFSDAQVEDYFRHFYEFVLADEVVTFDAEYASETVRRFFDASGPHGPILKAANVPPGFVIIQRINLGLYAVLGQLRATANWRRIAEEIWPFVEGPPSTPLGELEAEWAAGREVPAP
ncbi:MAG: ABC1 kinase family protein [Acidimicrobiia bacterium]